MILWFEVGGVIKNTDTDGVRCGGGKLKMSLAGSYIKLPATASVLKMFKMRMR
ncbi:Uncharacterised protein [Zhongshania aliphaticivorans]|uniref:Uncharacterized protein n=1 Tax=Zhongshania aliphaticivorans TaxID=1470434 RepID=A0A5S9Q0W8_9GAMM|nr:Uncharacterised protein [Zhongshania aliphaticivorans]CAA0118488.1 Uncharacterised protein [Zhongshania aliphaticivorans]